MFYFLVSGPKFTEHFWLNAKRTVLGNITPILIILTRSGNICDQIWSCIKSHQIFHVFGPKFFWEGPNFGDLRYKIQWDIDHIVAKFHGDRPLELGDCVTKLKKKSRVKHKSVRNYRPGRPNKKCSCILFQFHFTCASRFLRSKQLCQLCKRPGLGPIVANYLK